MTVETATARSTGIVVAGLTKSFGETRVLRGIDFEVEPGTMLALLGPNGAGKTTTVRILATLLAPDSGTVLVGGHDVMSDPVGARQSFGLTGQATSVDELLTGRENLVMMGRLLGLDTAAAGARADELLCLFNLEDAANRRAKTYSGGMKRRLDLAAGLVRTPSILFLDEPTTGLDPLARQRVWDIVRKLMSGGTTVLLTTQYLQEADLLADRIVVIDDGRVVTEGTPPALKRRVGAERAELVFANVAELSTAAALLGETGIVRDVAKMKLTIGIDDPWQLYDVLDRLRRSELKPHGVTVTEPTLDDVFLAVTATGNGQGRRP